MKQAWRSVFSKLGKNWLVLAIGIGFGLLNLLPISVLGSPFVFPGVTFILLLFLLWSTWKNSKPN